MDAHESENPKPPSNLAESNDGSTRHSRDSHRSRSHWGLSTAVHGVGFVAKKMVNNRITDSLWSMKKSSSSSSANASSDASSSIPNAQKENLSNETLSDQTSKDEQTTKLTVSSKPTHERQKRGKYVFDGSENLEPITNANVFDESENLKPPDGSNVSTTSSNVVDELETPKHQDASHAKLVNQHRWPNTTSSNVIDHSGTSKPSNSSHVRPVNQHRWPTTTGSNVIDHLENLKPPDGSHVKLVTQQLWPTTVGSNVLSKNANPLEEVSKTYMIPDRRMLQESSSDPTTESQPSTPKMSHGLPSRGASPSPAPRGASLIPPSKLVRMLQESSSDPKTESQPSTPNKSHGLSSRGVSPSPAPRGASLIPPSKKARGVSLTPAIRAIRGVSLTPATRGVSLTPVTRKVDPPSVTRDMGVDPSQIAKGGGPSIAAARGLSPTPTTRGASLIPPPRGISPTPTTKQVNPLPEYHTPLQPSSPIQSFNPSTNTVSISKEPDLPPTRGVSPSPSDRQASPTHSTRGVSPTPTRHSDLADIGRRVISRAKGVNPISSKSSGSTRHFFSTSLLSMFTSTRKEKIMEERKEASQNLEQLQNIQVQWQFLNADTKAAMDLQRVNAEKSLFDMWSTILELRDSLAAKKIDITLSILQLKLYAVLYRQVALIDGWATIEREHESALTATVNDLVTRSILLPIIGGVKVKADVKLLKFIICSSVEVMQATISSIQSTLAKVGGTRHLASELVNVALNERALLDECEIFLASAAPLQIEECSLRSYLIQLNRIQ